MVAFKTAVSLSGLGNPQTLVHTVATLTIVSCIAIMAIGKLLRSGVFQDRKISDTRMAHSHIRWIMTSTFVFVSFITAILHANTASWLIFGLLATDSILDIYQYVLKQAGAVKTDQKEDAVNREQYEI